jgi:hypothetical protein
MSSINSGRFPAAFKLASYALLLGVGGLAQASGAFCSDTAQSLNRACGYDVLDNYWVAIANCTNESEAADRVQCFKNAVSTRSEESSLCHAQLRGRIAACGKLGENRYDPEFEPRMFDGNFSHLAHSNPYFPLRIGNRWDYRSGTETNSVEITADTKLIDDVTCVVARDLVYEDGVLTEATDDWFAQARNGDVWYCGEEVKGYESFDGDVPQTPELVSVDGRFKADVDDAKPGIIFKAHPIPNTAYLEEFSPANAEDYARVVSINYSHGENATLDRLVPRRLALLLCHHDCVVTENVSLLEPGVLERKYYAPGIGVFLETDQDRGEVSQLVSCNFDSRCNSLPAP